MNYVKFIRGTPKNFSALAHKDADTIYFISEQDETIGQLWIGDKLISISTNSEGILAYLNELKDVDVSGVTQGKYLGYDSSTQTWKPMSIWDAIKTSIMIGATEDSDGIQGLVPQPKNVDSKKFLRGDGSWGLPDELSPEGEKKIDQKISTKVSIEDFLNVKTEVVNLTSVLNNQSNKITVVEDNIKIIEQDVNELKKSTTWISL